MLGLEIFQEAQIDNVEKVYIEKASKLTLKILKSQIEKIRLKIYENLRVQMSKFSKNWVL